ncbi:hypothetical protein AB0O01_07490 [Streptomyces sp. NPDC093252]|uniref:hypothetical protein n=1 Tax=Streptomyces sp. NPDC093252 TaxID=3154980 RepID=UPI003418A036
MRLGKTSGRTSDKPSGTSSGTSSGKTLRKTLTGLGLAALVATGTVAMTAPPAAAAHQYVFDTYWSSTQARADAGCQDWANRYNQTNTGFYWCGADKPPRSSAGLYGTHLWVRVN